MKKVRILSIDGGGIRGIIPATVMLYIEQKLRQKTNNPDARIADYFDLIVGTSTGGLLSCFYLCPPKAYGGNNNASTRYSAAQVLMFYLKKGYSIFNASKNYRSGLGKFFNPHKYNPKVFSEILKKELGTLKMRELIRPCIITAYDMKSKSAIFFSSREDDKIKREYYVKDVLMSTTAAPTYFPPVTINNLITKEVMVNIDGGVFANNPSMCAFAEAKNTDFPKKNKPGAEDMLILSVGTGGGMFKLKNVHNAAKWSLIKWADRMSNIMIDGSVDTVHYQMDKIFSSLGNEGRKNYKRIDVPVEKRNYSSNMADAGKKNIDKLRKAGDEALKASFIGKDTEYSLDKFIDLLIENN